MRPGEKADNGISTVAVRWAQASDSSSQRRLWQIHAKLVWSPQASTCLAGAHSSVAAKSTPFRFKRKDNIVQQFCHTVQQVNEEGFIPLNFLRRMPPREGHE